jgi:protein O-GlcNAc transferase
LSTPSERAKELNAQGNARKAAGDVEGAAACYRQALEADARSPSALYNLALCLRELGRATEAEQLLGRLLEIEPRDGDALFHLGEILFQKSNFAAAMPVLRRAAALQPDNALVHLYMGVALVRQFEVNEAEACLRRALALEPGAVDAHLCLGDLYSLTGARDRALESYRAASNVDPDNPIVLSALLYETLQLCDWSQFEDLERRLRQSLDAKPGMPILPFPLLAIRTTPQEQLLHARRYSESVARAAAAERARLGLRFAKKAGGRIRIGYLSSDLHEHATAYLTAELFELHDRRRFEIHAYSYGPDDGSPMRARLKRAFDRFVEIGPFSESDAARAIHADGVDILVDLKGHTLYARSGILALRPAPVQVSYLGYPGTMGAEFVDYLVGDRFVTPAEHAAHFSEQLVRLPGSYQVNDRKRAVAATPPRPELGLPEGAFVFCCFNQTYKILPDLFDAWLALLGQVPGSVLWLLDGSPGTANNLRAHARKRGVAAERLVFAPRWPLERHLGRLAAADLFLDTFPCNAHTTASDALWAGLPVLTLAGETFASRVAGSLLEAAGLPELVARSLDEYRASALRLAADRGALVALRERLARQRQAEGGPFDTPLFARRLEAAYEAMWQNYLEGRAPRSLEIPA